MRGMVLAGLSVLTAMVLAVQPTRHATRHGAPDPMVQPRPAREEDLARDAIPPGLYARAHSFWGETSLAPCAVSAVWTGDLAFAPLMRLPAAEGLPARTPAIEPGTPANVRVVDFRPAPRRRPKRRYDTFRQAA